MKVYSAERVNKVNLREALALFRLLIYVQMSDAKIFGWLLRGNKQASYSSSPFYCLVVEETNMVVN